jgi:Vacuolar (H+)-ATPase G subunit.
MRQTLLSAQRMAENMVAEAETKRVSLLQEAEDAARSKLERLREEYDHTQYRLETAQQNTAASVTRMREILTQQLGYLDELDTLTAPAAPPDFVGDAVREIEWSMTQEKEGDGQEEAESLEETLVSAGDFAAASAEIPSGSVEEEEPKRTEVEAEAELETEEYDDSAPTRTFSSEETEALLERIAKVEEETSEEARDATGRIDFDNLAFGENYEN